MKDLSSIASVLPLDHLISLGSWPASTYCLAGSRQVCHCENGAVDTSRMVGAGRSKSKADIP